MCTSNEKFVQNLCGNKSSVSVLTNLQGVGVYTNLNEKITHRVIITNYSVT